MKTKENHLRKWILAATAIIVLVAIGILFINQIAKKRSEEIPEAVRTIKVKIGRDRVYKNKKGYWEADYGDGIIMVYIPEGKFTMGSGKGDPEEKPVHKVYLDGYWMGKTEVTVGQFRLFVEAVGYTTDAEKSGGAYTWTGHKWEQIEDINWKNPGFKQENNHPVVCVSWNDAKAYCDWLSTEKDLIFKLPTEAQWEKAACGTHNRKYPWDNSPFSGERANSIDVQAWLKFKFFWADKNIDDGYAYTAPVESYPQGASPYGLLDMAGNVWEWCNDWADNYSAGFQRNPTGPVSGPVRVMRGGSWYSSARNLRCASRGGGKPSDRNYGLGFRLCQDNRRTLE